MMVHKKFSEMKLNPDRIEAKDEPKPQQPKIAAEKVMDDSDEFDDFGEFGKFLRISPEEREFKDKVSESLGKMLLTGYTMMDIYCNHCMTVLMKKGDDLRCASCELLKVDKYAECVKSEINRVEIVEQAKLPQQPSTFEPARPLLVAAQPQGAPDVGTTVPLPPCAPVSGVDPALDALRRKIVWASEKMEKCDSLDGSERYLTFINSATDTIRRIQGYYC